MYKALSSFARGPALSRGFRLVTRAKKKGKGKKAAKQPKGSLLGELAVEAKVEPWQTTDVILQHFLLVESYRQAAGEPLLSNADMSEIADTLYEAPFALLAHDRFSEGVDDEKAVFTYANKLALEAFEAEKWSDLVGQLSSSCVVGVPEESATEREERFAQLTGSDGAKDQLVEFKGVRRSTQGNLFTVHNFKLWNIMSPTGEITGQAATFDTIEREGGDVVRLGAVPPPSADELAAAEAAVREQGDAVRALKSDGKGNNDPDVAAAVEELLIRKERLTALQEAAEAVEQAAA